MKKFIPEHESPENFEEQRELEGMTKNPLHTPEIDKSYLYERIEEWANDNGYSIDEYGAERIGEQFLKLSHDEKGWVVSFILDGSTSNGYTYKCIYSDLN